MKPLRYYAARLVMRYHISRIPKPRTGRLWWAYHRVWNWAFDTLGQFHSEGRGSE